MPSVVKPGLCLAALLAVMPAAPVSAQITLPQVQLPPVAPVDSVLDVNRTVNTVLESTNAELRRLRVRELLRSNRGTLEADPRGAPMVRSEIVALSPAPQALQRAQGAGFDVVRTHVLEGLDASVVVLRAPAGMSTRRALRELRRDDPDGVYDFNHIHVESGGPAAATPAAYGAMARNAIAAGTDADLKLGLIDSGIDRSHPVFQRSAVHEHGCAAAVPSAHGTAVASLMVGAADNFQGAAPGAQLYAADVYCGAATGGAVDAVAAALAWLAKERVPVINISLVGPANRTLEQIVRLVLARGHVVVAAVGNDGPGAPPLYPAAYPGVLGITGVDARNRVLIEACRGSHVAFAAPGADMSAATIEGRYSIVRGTSFASPIVAGLVARQMKIPDATAAQSAVALLASEALDLGARGADKTYGKGLVGAQLRMPQSLARSGE